MRIRHLYISPGHNYFGHHGRAPGEHLMVECDEVECVAGRGIVGDRFFDYKANYGGQITLFAEEVYTELCEKLGVTDKTTSVFRRNVIVEGADLGSLVGVEFELNGVRLRGNSECSPCYWMDRAFAPGAEALLKGRGGLRATILSSGKLRKDLA
ncbi:MAG: MOSC domain-containing protein [Verrucomicrobiota bacterium]